MEVRNVVKVALRNDGNLYYDFQENGTKNPRLGIYQFYFVGIIRRPHMKFRIVYISRDDVPN